MANRLNDADRVLRFNRASDHGFTRPQPPDPAGRFFTPRRYAPVLNSLWTPGRGPSLRLRPPHLITWPKAVTPAIFWAGNQRLFSVRLRSAQGCGVAKCYCFSKTSLQALTKFSIFSFSLRTCMLACVLIAKKEITSNTLFAMRWRFSVEIIQIFGM